MKKEKRDNVYRKYAFFDLDHTLLPHDTQLLFCNYILQKKGGYRRLFVFLFLFVAPVVIFSSDKVRRLKQIFLCYLYKLREEDVEELAEIFARETVLTKIFPEVLEKYEELKTAGYYCILTSASPDIYVKYIAEELGFDDYFATKVKRVKKYGLFPVIIGKNNKNFAKLEHMSERYKEVREIIARDSNYLNYIEDSYAFSDSSADLPLLEISANKFLINPNSSLEKFGISKGWTILKTKQKPKHNLYDKLLKVFGFYSKAHPS